MQDFVVFILKIIIIKKKNLEVVVQQLTLLLTGTKFLGLITIWARASLCGVFYVLPLPV